MDAITRGATQKPEEQSTAQPTGQQPASQKNTRVRSNAAQKIVRPRRPRVLPGFSLSLGLTVGWLGFMVVIPIAAMSAGLFRISFADLLGLLTRKSATASLVITLQYSFIAAAINAVAGFIIAWTIVRYKFFGSKLLDSVIDLPFALPGAVGGIALASVFSADGPVGALFARYGIQLIYNQFGILIGLVFVTLPFSVRAVQPLIAQLDDAQEQAARLLGAQPRHIFWKVQLPALLPGITSGFILSFARSIGEFGTVVFVAGNIPLKSEVVSRYIYNKLEQYDVQGAIAMASVLLLFSFCALFALNAIEFSRRRQL